MPSGYLGMTHPSVGTYNEGCRCGGCKTERTAYMRKWRDRPGNREKHNAWVEGTKKKPRGKAARNARERIRRRPDPLSVDYRVILESDPCCYCGAPMRAVDHIEPIARDGTDDWNNLTAACCHCNSSKNARTLLEFLAQKG